MRKTNEIREFIIANVENHPKDITALVAETFSISRQAAFRHVKKLVKEKALRASGATLNRKYELIPILEKEWEFQLENLTEDKVWRETVAPIVQDIPANVLKICQHGFTEMVNNAIDHSGGTKLYIFLLRYLSKIEMRIRDNGIGIFRKIQQELDLDDVLHAILELSKGKLTTDPKNHSGEGIFFTSRMFDEFSILSDELFFSHFITGSDVDGQDWLLETKGKTFKGTIICMSINLNTVRTTQEVFDHYSVKGDYSFSKTHIPVFLAKYGDENLISRSQAKRLLTRFERFKEIVLDFHGIDSIGQAFADEIFRVFKNAHPEINLQITSANAEVMKMIQRAQSENV